MPTTLMKKADFEQLICDGINILPQNIRAAMENIDFVLEDEVRPAEAREIGFKLDGSNLLLGLYRGVPKISRGYGYGRSMTLPDKITIFQRPIEELAAVRRQDLRDLVYEVVRHEIGHHLGLNDKEIHAIEAKRRERGNRKKQSP